MGRTVCDWIANVFLRFVPYGPDSFSIITSTIPGPHYHSLSILLRGGCGILSAAFGRDPLLVRFATSLIRFGDIL